MFEFIQKQQLQDHHFKQKIEWLIPGFIAKQAAILIYAKGGTGKSFVAKSLAKYAAQQTMEVLYLDYDNSLITLIERGVQHKLLDQYPNIHYVHRASCQLSSEELLQQLEEKAVSGAYKNTFIVIDSLKNFADISNDKKASDAMKRITNIRDAGATIVILSHTNKSESNYQGSSNVRDAVDSMYRVEKIDSPADQLRLILNSEKERLPVVDTAIAIKEENLELSIVDINSARLTTDEKHFIDQVKVALTKTPGINKTALLTELGYEKTDKTARDRLDQYETIYWQSKKVKGAYTYKLM